MLAADRLAPWGTRGSMTTKRYAPTPKRSRHALRTVAVLAATAVGCIHSNHDGSESFTVHDPHAVAGAWYKANLHMHSTHSDGRFDPEAWVQLYRDAGYTLLAITDHNQYGDQDGGVSSRHQRDAVLRDWNGDGVLHPEHRLGSGVEAYVRDWTQPRPDWMLDVWHRPADADLRDVPVLLPGFEASYSYFGAHFGVVGHPAGPIDPPRPGFAWLAPAEDARGFAFIAHPGDASSAKAALELTEAIPAERFHAMEIVNGQRLTRGENADATQLWDALWTAGFRLWGLANDDAHKPPGETDSFPFSAYTMVRCASPTERGFLDALRAGSFYASTGLEFATLRLVDGERIEVHVPGAESVTFIGAGRVVLHHQTGETATYVVQGSEGYVRVEATGDVVEAPRNAWRRAAWSQPFRIVTD